MCKRDKTGDDRTLTVSAVVTDIFDGSVRLFCDAQRFGFSIHDFHLEATEGDGASIRATLAVPPDADAEHIRCRLARHGTVLSLDAA